jgi:aldehyde dehydrogenase (NAD+)
MRSLSGLSAVLQQMRPALAPFIGGTFVSTGTRTIHPLVSPVDGHLVASVASANAEDVERAVQAARCALQWDAPWSNYTGAQRRDTLLAISDLIRQHRDEFAMLESANCGKPIRSAIEDIDETIACFRWFAGCADRLAGQVALNVNANHHMHQYTIRQPAGICALIVSFNYPLMLAAWKMAAALAVGSAVLLKPALQTPLTSLRLAQLIAETDRVALPPGVFSVLPGDGQVGQALSEHPAVDRCSFTGSGTIGREILRASAKSNLKRCTLELGGKSAILILPDADLDQAVEHVFNGAFSNSGQNCCAGSRLLLHADIHDAFLERLYRRVKETRIGVEDGDELGPLIDQRQFDKVRGFIERAQAQGQGKLLCGGTTLPDEIRARLPQQFLGISPTIFYDVDDDAEIAHEEIFGPVLTVLKPFQTPEEAVKRANHSVYGLAAAVWTRSLGQAHRIAQQLRAGTVWVNHYNYLYPYLPFGGVGQSGFGKDLGEAALDEFSDVKSISMCF